MAVTKVSDGVAMLVARHAAAGATVGAKALTAVKSISNTDPSEGIWRQDDQFIVPSKELLDQAVFVAKVNGNDAPAIAVDLVGGGSKVLYISSLKKNVIEYEEDGDQFVVKKLSNGTTMPAHIARVGGKEDGEETPLRKEVMSKATVSDIINSLAGRKFKVANIMGPYKTSRLKAKFNAVGERDGYEVVGLRNTSIPVFEEVK